MELLCNGEVRSVFEGESSLPFKDVDCMKILGAVFADRFSFRARSGGMVICAKTRMTFLGRVAGRTWWAETSILRLTSKALAGSLPRSDSHEYGRIRIGFSSVGHLCN